MRLSKTIEHEITSSIDIMLGLRLQLRLAESIYSRRATIALIMHQNTRLEVLLAEYTDCWNIQAL